MKTKEFLRFQYGMEVKEKGMKAAFIADMEETEKNDDEEAEKYFKKQYGEDANFMNKAQKSACKLDTIVWSLEHKKIIENKKIIPLLVKELKNITADLEGLVNE